MPKNSNKPKNKKPAKKASRDRARSPSPFSDSDSGGDQVQALNAGGQAVASPDSRSRASSPENASRSRTSSHSRSRASSRVRTPTHQDVVNDDFEDAEVSSTESVGSPQVLDSHPLSKDEVLHPRQEVLASASDPPREVHSPFRLSESDDSDLQCLGHTAAPEANSANEADQAGSPAGGETGNFPNFPRANPALVESVTIPQSVFGTKPVNAESSTLSIAAKQDALPTNLLGGGRAPNDEQKKKNKKAKEAARPLGNANAAADREDPVEKKGQRASDAAKPAEESKNKAAEEKKAAKRTKSSDGPIRDASSADVANLLSMVKTLKEQVEGSNAKLMKQAQAAILSEERYREMRERELTEEDARATAQAGEIARLQGQLDEAAAKQHEAPPKFQQLDDPEFAARFESLMKTGLYSLEDVRAALETTKQEGKYSSTRADAYLKAILVSKRNDVLQRANQGVADDQPSIQPGSALARLLGTFGNEDAVDIVVKLKDVHAKRKTSHSAAPAVAASNLLQAAAVKGDCHLSRKGFTFLSHVATAVCEDCDKCQELRSEAEAAERWRATKAAAVAAASQSKKKGESAGHKRSPFLSLPFKTNDSRRDVRKPRCTCAGCRKGAAGGKWLYFCDDCNRGFHSLCVDWKHLRHPSGGATWFSCADCVEQRDADIG
jgi:hypothetical protein